MSLYPLIASLIRAERTHRQARSISYRIGGAKFPVLKDLDTFVFADTPIDQGQVRELATGTFLDAKRNAIFIGGTGSAKPICASPWPRRSSAPPLLREPRHFASTFR
jgi:IstB-like ATP binding protein